VSGLLARKQPTPQEFVATMDTFGESGTADQLLEKYGLDTKDVVAKAKAVLARK